MAGLVDHVAAAIGRYRAGEQTASEVDAMIHQYSRAARELWTFCWAGGDGAHTEFVAAEKDRQPADDHRPDWWQHGEPRRRRPWRSVLVNTPTRLDLCGSTAKTIEVPDAQMGRYRVDSFRMGR